MRRLGSAATRLAVPAGESGLFLAHGTGVLIYTARPKADGTTGLKWVETGVEDDLIDDTGMAPNMGFQGLGDTLATRAHSDVLIAKDSSRIATEVVAAVAAPPAGAAPWLLMRARNLSNKGLFSGVHYVQRIMTAGGWPRRDASAARPDEQVRVPYSATYVFYGTTPGNAPAPSR
jgi:hypothetical protein